MKLRNKDTKQLGVFNIKVVTPDCDYSYETIDDMWKEWEKWKPHDPLIQDEQSRKVLREWAEFQGFDELRYNKAQDCLTPSGYGTNVSISFRDWKICKNLIDQHYYLIEELCGKDDN